MPTLYAYRPIVDPHAVIELRLPPGAIELATLAGQRYVVVPDGATLPADQPAGLTAQAVTLTDALRTALRAASPHYWLADERRAERGDAWWRAETAQLGIGQTLLERQTERITEINAECRSRLVAKYGPPEEQVSRSLGVYGQAARDAMTAGIAATIDASNAAQNAILGATTLAQVETVTVTWPAL